MRGWCLGSKRPFYMLSIHRHSVLIEQHKTIILNFCRTVCYGFLVFLRSWFSFFALTSPTSTEKKQYQKRCFHNQRHLQKNSIISRKMLQTHFRMLYVCGDPSCCPLFHTLPLSSEYNACRNKVDLKITTTRAGLVQVGADFQLRWKFINCLV